MKGFCLVVAPRDICCECGNEAIAIFLSKAEGQCQAPDSILDLLAGLIDMAPRLTHQASSSHRICPPAFPSLGAGARAEGY